MPNSTSRLVSIHGEQVVVATRRGVRHGAGSGPGAAVEMELEFRDQYRQACLPADGAYAVTATPDQAAFVSIKGKSSSGFSVVLTPIDSSTTLAEGAFDAVVIAA